MTGDLHHDGGRVTLRFERQLPHPAEKVWRALTDNDELAYWFPVQIQGERRAGSKVTFVFTDEVISPEIQKYFEDEAPFKPPTEEETANQEGEILVFQPPRVLEFSWGDDILRFELQGAGEQTLLVFTHSFDDESRAARDASGWDLSFDSLERRLAGLDPEPFSPGLTTAKFEEYAARFGPQAAARREA
jgi:uncharacterized protein YndB with AHSA1/START domain